MAEGRMCEKCVCVCIHAWIIKHKRTSEWHIRKAVPLQIVSWVDFKWETEKIEIDTLVMFRSRLWQKRQISKPLVLLGDWLASIDTPIESNRNIWQRLHEQTLGKSYESLSALWNWQDWPLNRMSLLLMYTNVNFAYKSVWWTTKITKI